MCVLALGLIQCALLFGERHIIVSDFLRSDEKSVAFFNSLNTSDPSRFFEIYVEGNEHSPIGYQSEEEEVEFFNGVRENVHRFLSDPTVVEVRTVERGDDLKIEYWFTRPEDLVLTDRDAQREAMVIPVYLVGEDQQPVFGGGVQFINFKVEYE